MRLKRGVTIFFVFALVEIALIESFQVTNQLTAVRSTIFPTQEFRIYPQRRLVSTVSLSTEQNSNQMEKKNRLVSLLNKVPRNAPTPKALTNELLVSARELELFCPTKNNEVLTELGGNWELIWTAQDPISLKEQDQNPVFTWIK